MRPSKFFVLMIASLVIASCTKVNKDPDGVNGNEDAEGSATFRVKSLDGDGTVAPVFKKEKDGVTWLSNWRIPTAVNFNFVACIQDRTTRADAVGHRFQVEDPLTKRQIPDIRPTVEGGCFTWIETIDYDYFVERSHWGVVERDIIGSGVHTGRQRVRLALNPWAVGDGARDKGDEVRYLKVKPLPPNVLSRVIGPNAFGSNLGDPASIKPDKMYVEDVHIQTIRRGERNNGMYFRMNITMEPKVRFENHAGVPGMRHLMDGDFIVIAHLVLNNAGPGMNKRVILTSGGKPNIANAEDTPGVQGTGKLINGKLIARVDAWVDPRLPQGNLELAIKLIPKGVRGLKPFEGIFELGTMRNLSSSFSGAQKEECRDSSPEGCVISPYLKGADNFKELQAQGYANGNSPYLFDRLKLRFVQVQPGETTTQRTVAYSASTCVIDAFTGERPIGLPFTIQYKTPTNDGDAKTGIIRKTEEDGCLNWSSTINHSYYHPEEFIEQVVSIKKDTGFSRDLRFYINPWDDKFTFGFDEREFRPEFWVEMKKRRKIPSRFFLADFSYHTVRFQYNIDSLMNLEVRKTVLMDLSPRVLRYSGIVNARKMTEPLRDGIWLLKVGIQKNYLDPASMGVQVDVLRANQSQVRLQNESPKARERMSSNRLRKLGIVAPSKEFISTQTSLVRSTDGVIIQPVELNMQDLRLMRVRSNFMLQLETVDERKLQAHNVMHKGFSEEIDRLLEDRRKGNEHLGKAPDDEDEKLQIEKEEKRIREIVDTRKSLVRRLFDEISEHLNTSSTEDVRMDEFSLDEDQQRFMAPLFKKLNIELEANDFTNIKLPSCGDINCNNFLEEKSGLMKRSFVGPVIFLSNGYSDSVRATDNLDEAMCGIKVDFDDPLEAELRGKERELFMETDEKIVEGKERRNTIYKFSEYFGSLRHLCFTHVDDLIAREREDRYLYNHNIPAVSSVYNFANAFSLNFLSLADEKPKSVGMDPETLNRCGGDLVGCMRETEDHRISLSKALGWVESNLSHSRSWLGSIAGWISSGAAWSAEDIRLALFEKSEPSQRRFVGCTLLSENFARTIESNGKKVFMKTSAELQRQIMDACMSNHRSPLTFDRKLRVFKTGQEGDSYVFLGGYQMNINVGQSFSVSRSKSYSWGWGVEGTDFIGAANSLMGGGAGLLGKTGSALKPFSLKVSGSESMGDSEGTSISESTYLVAQIAKFRVRLDEFERCVVLSFTPEFHKVMELKGVISYDPSYHGPMRSVFVCEGQKIAEPTYVDETYFYFTQHFTEGDMLDQADLYNHPWLLALRGYRDFGSFVSLVRSQEVVSFWNFATGVFSPDKRPIDWPLAHMKAAYKQIVPSYPGFYTVLDKEEGLTEFPLETRLKMTDPDINYEVISRDRRTSGGERRAN